MPVTVPPGRGDLPGSAPRGGTFPAAFSPGTADTSQISPSGILGAGRAALELPQATIPLASRRLPPGPCITHRGPGMARGAGCFGAGAAAAKGCLLIRRQLRGLGLLVQGIWQLGQQSPVPFRGGLAAPRGGKGPT